MVSGSTTTATSETATLSNSTGSTSPAPCRRNPLPVRRPILRPPRRTREAFPNTVASRDSASLSTATWFIWPLRSYPAANTCASFSTTVMVYPPRLRTPRTLFRSAPPSGGPRSRRAGAPRRPAPPRAPAPPRPRAPAAGRRPPRRSPRPGPGSRPTARASRRRRRVPHDLVVARNHRPAASVRPEVERRLEGLDPPKLHPVHRSAQAVERVEDVARLLERRVQARRPRQHLDALDLRQHLARGRRHRAHGLKPPVVDHSHRLVRVARQHPLEEVGPERPVPARRDEVRHVIEQQAP